MRRSVRVALIVLAWLVILPAAAHAQASITGVVRDTSGAVLPGVSVEAASPALIEKVRSVVTDATGQYRIENLRPGTYTVTLTLPGFTSVKREGIELTGTAGAPPLWLDSSQACRSPLRMSVDSSERGRGLPAP